MTSRRVTLRGLIAGLAISAAILGGLRVASGQGLGPGGASPPPTTSQIAEMTQGQVPEPAAVEPAALDAGGQAAVLAAQLLLAPEEFFLDLPLVVR